MRRRMSTLWVAALAALLLAGLLGTTVPGSGAVAPAQTTAPTGTVAACTPPATSGPHTPTPAACALYECCERNGVSMAVLGVSTTDTSQFSRAEAGNTFLVLNVVIENVSSEETVYYSPLYFQLRGADGTQYDAEVLAPEPDLQSGHLDQGGRVRGNVAFEIPVDAAGLVTVFEPPTYPSVEIRESVGR